jgi:predicted alpha/beta hydrolase
MMDIRTADGFALAATLYDANSDRVMLIASAMGVKRRYYDAFASHVAAQGTSVVTFDYRGIGDSRPRSLRGFAATMVEWGRLDIAAALGWIRRELRPRALLYAGHSCGGQLAGLAPNAGEVDRFLFVCCQSGYWRHWPGVRAYGLGALWALMPVVSSIAGYFPSRLFGLGSEDLPRGVASQWGTWGRHPEYLFSEVDAAPYARLTAPILAYSFRDDHYAPRAAVDALLRKYSGAAVERRHVEERGFGHFDYFRRSRGEPLWPDAVRWLKQ